MATAAPIIIRKSFIGLLFINAFGLALFAGLTYVALVTGLLARQPLAAVYATGAALVALATLIQGYVYRSSYIELTDDRLIFTTYSTLLVANTSETFYSDIQDVSFQKPGLLAMLFDTGTLIVNSASGAHLLTLSWIPNPEHWCIYLMQQAKRTQVTYLTAGKV